MKFNSFLFSICLLANMCNTISAQQPGPITIRRSGGINLTNIGNSGNYVYVTNLIGFNTTTFYGAGSLVDNWVFYGNNTFSDGTNRFTGPTVLTNTGNTISGNGAGLTNLGFAANGLGIRLLWSSPTNFYFPSIATNATPLTNNGDYAKGTSIFVANMPALLGSNSHIVLLAQMLRTNANSSAATFQVFAGPNTNFIGGLTGWGTTVGIGGFTLSDLLQNCGSFSQQMQGVTFANPQIIAVTNFVNTSVPFTLYVASATTTSHTNAQLFGVKFYEFYAP